MSDERINAGDLQAATGAMSGAAAGMARQLPPPGAWVAELHEEFGNHPQIAKVREAYPEHDALDLVMYSASGEKLGRLSPPMGGPRGFEPFCGAQYWVQIEEPPFAEMADSGRYGWAHLLKPVRQAKPAQSADAAHVPQENAAHVPQEDAAPVVERLRSRP